MSSKTERAGKHALFSPEVMALEDPGDDPLMGGEAPSGRYLLYSVGAHRAGSVVFECSRCELRTRMSAIEAGLRILMVSAWVPLRHHSRWVLCPRCRQRTWSRIEWLS